MKDEEIIELVTQGLEAAAKGEFRSLRLSSPARARTVRRAIYLSRQEIPEGHPLRDAWDTLRIRISGPYLTLEQTPHSPVKTELRSLLEQGA